MTPEPSVASLMLEHESPIGPLETGVSSFLADVDGPSLLSVNALQINAHWSRTLPRVNNSNLRSDEIISRFPRLFSEAINAAVEQTLTGYSPQVPFQLRLISLKEAVTAAPGLSLPPAVWARFRVQPDYGFGALGISPDFTISVIHQLLGGQEPIEVEMRPVSGIEKTVLKFLCCDVVRQLNEGLHAPLFQVESVGPVVPEWLRPDNESAEFVPHFIVQSEIKVGRCWGFIHTYVTHEFLMQVTRAVTARPSIYGKGLSVGGDLERRLEWFNSIVRDVTLAIVVGETDVTVEELRCLDAGDVVLISRPAGFWSPGPESQSAQVIVSEGEAHIIRGTISTTDNGQLSLTAEDLFSSSETRHSSDPETNPMDHDNNGKRIFGDEGEALGGLLLTVRVQMAARKARLEELSQLRVGQVLPLGRTASDPVDLVIDGRRIAEGELVEIEGNLGVRVIEIAKP